MMYQRKNSTINAIQWTTDNYQAVIDFTGGNVALTADGTCVIINGQTVCGNDWIIKSVGKETSVGPQVTRLSIMSDAVFQTDFELYQGFA